MNARQRLEEMGVDPDDVAAVAHEEMGRIGAVNQAIQNRRDRDPNFTPGEEAAIANWLGHDSEAGEHFKRIAGADVGVALEWAVGRFRSSGRPGYAPPAGDPYDGRTRNPYAMPVPQSQGPLPPGRDAGPELMGGSGSPLPVSYGMQPLTDRDASRLEREAYIKRRLRESIVLPP